MVGPASGTDLRFASDARSPGNSTHEEFLSPAAGHGYRPRPQTGRETGSRLSDSYQDIAPRGAHEGIQDRLRARRDPRI